MLEWLAAATGVELSKLVLEQILDLGKPVLDGYVQDFFRDCLDSGVARLKTNALKTPMAQAIGFFMQRFVKELQFLEVPETSIQHHYRGALKQFVRDKSVRPILGKAFETGCKKIDYGQLERIWTENYQGAGWQFPSEEFDWRGLAREYVIEVKGIIKADAELRSLLETDLLEEIAHNTAQVSPGFDVFKYRDSLQASYGYLKLYTLDSTDRVDAVKLWSMFIQQTVREALPPIRYDLPLDLKRQLQADGQLEADLSPEALELYRREYFQQPTRKVLEAVAESQRAVILGDPGAGKSSLLQFLALDWVEGKTEALPLLIELREYVLAQSASFLDFLHRGSGADWQFDQQKLHQHLSENPTLVMFDGLDEIFDRSAQAAITDDIIRFAQQYPQARVLVTSRIIGYNPERFQHAGFSQFTMQPLDEAEIHEFIDRWYDLSMGNDPDKVRLKQRLKTAIANSKAIQNLADNPLLLTMMAILNRRQELPRDRADLYDQASRVLLYHWDVDHKRLQLPMDAIGRREKQEMLRLIAYEMQAGEEGLKGNLIGSDRLISIITNYLRDQGFSEPREKANRLIQQLRERNFILCYRGADTYGFMHRTFLEYFCAVEIVHRFEKQRTLTFEQLRDEVFGQHWQDETWHEVLRLICGISDVKISELLIIFLTEKRINKKQFLEEIHWGSSQPFRSGLREDGLTNLILAAECLSEIKNRSMIQETEIDLLKRLQEEIEYDIYPARRKELDYSFTSELANTSLRTIANTWKGNPAVLSWFKDHLLKSRGTWISAAAVRALVQGWGDHPETFGNLCQIIKGVDQLHICQKQINRYVPAVQFAAIQEIARGWRELPETSKLLKRLVKKIEEPNLQQTALVELARGWRKDPEVLQLLKQCAQSNDCFFGVRSEAITELANGWSREHWMFQFLCDRAVNDPFVRKNSTNRNPRLRALEALLKHYNKNHQILELLQDRATNDPDAQLRLWAQEQLETQNSEFKVKEEEA